MVVVKWRPSSSTLSRCYWGSCWLGTPGRYPVRSWHYSDVMMGAMATQSPASLLFTPPFIQAQMKKTSKLRVTGLCAGNSPETGELPAQMANYAENVSFDDVIMRWRDFRLATSSILYEKICCLWRVRIFVYITLWYTKTTPTSFYARSPRCRSPGDRTKRGGK